MEKLQSLENRIRGFKSAVIAFSGGVDSTLLARVARDILSDKLLLVTATSSTYPFYELEEAKKTAAELNIPHRVIVSEELEIPGYSDNPPDRCYYCKSELFTKICHIASAEGYEVVLDGSNAEDVNDFRPGMKAKKEKGVISPLADAGLTKAEIRTLSESFSLSTAVKQSYACLASRFPYGERITREKLDRVATVELRIRKLGFTQFRVRSHGDIARLEFIPGEMPAAIEIRDLLVSDAKNAGFRYVTIDLEGYRTGSMNEVLSSAAIRRYSH